MADIGMLSFSAPDEDAMVAFGQRLGTATGGEGTLFLEGDLGMGKTTLCRGVLAAFGHRGAVKSPTYTLVEPYDLGGTLVYHFDLYRLADPEELEYVGIRDYFSNRALRLIEWPKRGKGVLPTADLIIEIEREGDGRLIHCLSLTRQGGFIMDRLCDLMQSDY